MARPLVNRRKVSVSLFPRVCCELSIRSEYRSRSCVIDESLMTETEDGCVGCALCFLTSSRRTHGWSIITHGRTSYAGNPSSPLEYRGSSQTR